jgi:hypothetical protein
MKTCKTLFGWGGWGDWLGLLLAGTIVRGPSFFPGECLDPFSCLEENWLGIPTPQPFIQPVFLFIEGKDLCFSCFKKRNIESRLFGKPHNTMQSEFVALLSHKKKLL